MRLLDSPTGPERTSFDMPSSWAASVAVVSQGRRVVVAVNSFLMDGDTAGGAKPRRVKTGMRTVTALAVSPDGRTLLAGGRPGLVERYDAERLALLGAFEFELGGVNSLAFAPDGFTFAVGGEDGLAVCDAEF